MFSRDNHRAVFTLAVLACVGWPLAGAQGQQPAIPQPDSRPPASTQSANPPSMITPQGLELIPSEHGLTFARAKESYTNLTLEGSELHPQPPLSTDHEKNTDFERELVRLQWRTNDPVDLYVVKPPQGQPPPVVLFLDGFPTNLDLYRDNKLCKYLVKNGTAAVGFESAHTGYRAERGPRNLSFAKVLPESLTVTVHDIQLILNYLEKRGDLDMTRVGMFAEGSGGAIAILAAATDHRLKAIDLLNPWGDWPDWLAKSSVVPKEERDNYLKPEFLRQVAPLDPVLYLAKLTSCAVRMQFWDDDFSRAKETKEAAVKLEAAAPATAKIAHYPSPLAMSGTAAQGSLFEWLAATLSSPKVRLGGKGL